MIMRTHAPRGFAAALAGFEKNIAAQDIWIEPARDGERSVVGHDNRLFEACKRNPILTHRHLGAGEPVQCVGHADLLLHPTVGWLLACLGMTRARNPGETFSYCGRETFVAPVRSSTIRSRGSWTVGSRISVSISSIPVGRSWLRGSAGFPRSWSWTLTRMDCHVQ